jgi:hypothetical protein
LTVVAPLLAVKVNAPDVDETTTVAKSALNFVRAAEAPRASLRVRVSTPVTEPVAPLANVTKPALVVVSVSEPEPPTIVSPTARAAVIESSPAPPLIERGVVDPAVIVSLPEPPMRETVTAFGVTVTAPVAALQSNLVVVPLKFVIVSADDPEAVTVADATRFSATELLAVVLTRLVVSTVPGIVIAEPDTLLRVRVTESAVPLTADSCHANEAVADVLVSLSAGLVLLMF